MQNRRPTRQRKVGDDLRPSGWSRQFTEPIPLPNGRKLSTLRDAALYITKLPKAEHDAPESAATTDSD
jgi:hypothetical protein